MTKNPFLSVDKRILADSGTSDEVRRNLFYLCDDIGPRFAGTEGYWEAAEYMRDRFKAYKLDTAELEPFEIVGWQRGLPARLEMTKPLSCEYPCYELPYSPATPEAGITAGLVDIGGGSKEEIAACAKKIKGKLVLTNGKSGHRREVFDRCVSAGAVGFILSNRTPGMLLQTGSVGDGAIAKIPSISIPLETALELQRLNKDGKARFKLFTDGACEPAATCNVVGEIKGTSRSKELVLIGGHLDSHEIGPGAFDNCAGAVLVMEAARLLAKQRKHLKRTVRFIGFAAEEIGLVGSHYHARTHAKELKKARFMLNCDMPAPGSPHVLAFHKYPAAKRYVEKLSEEMKSEIKFGNVEHCYSDHYPFVLKGVPTSGIGGRGSGVSHFCHMAADTPEKVSTDGLRDKAAFAARVLLRAASDPKWPDARRSAAEVKKWREKGSYTARRAIQRRKRSK